NLLHNACKFSPPQKPIAVKLDAETQGRPMARIDVIDQGVGLSVQEQNIVCDPFQQTRTTLARSQGGLGIGLTLVKGLVEMHGGQLTVTSPGEGCGSTFSIRLPLHIQAITPAPLPETPPTTEVLPTETHPAETQDFVEADSAIDELAESDVGIPDRTTQRVLVIDDRLDAILPIRVILRKEGHEVFEAHDGPTGV